MITARRLYIYFIAGVSLAMTSIGLVNLLALALSRIAEAFGGAVIVESADEIRRQLSLYAAFVIVAFPVWLLHWWLAERAVHRAGAEGEHERASAIRALYLTLAMALPLMFLIISSVSVLETLLRKGFDRSYTIGDTHGFWMSIAFMLVAGAVIAYHWHIRRRDESTGEVADVAAWLPRLYRYGAVFAGAMLLLFGVADIIRVVNDAIFNVNDVFAIGPWWAPPLSSGVARALIGLIVWGVYWESSLSVLRRLDWRGDTERRSWLRWFYVYAIIVVSVLVTLNGVRSSLDGIFQWILISGRFNTFGDWERDIIRPLALAVPFAVFWVYHRLYVMGSERTVGEGRPVASLSRLYIYLVALVGLALMGVGAAWVMGILIDLLLGGTRTISFSSLAWRNDVARYAALALVGAGAWAWFWNQAEQRVATADALERGATTRRVYLYATLAATLVAMLVSLAILLYRIISDVLGVNTTGNLVSAISAALGVVVVAGILFAYHLTVLRGDLAERAALPAERVANLRLSLTLIAPADADVDATLNELRLHLPEGYALEKGKQERPHAGLPISGQRLERDHA